MKLQPHEKSLVGNWIFENNRTRGDEVEERIHWLIANHLKKVTDSPQWGAWETLYKDPDDGRYWERTHPHGEMHGGGPLQLQNLTADEAKQKYSLP